MNNKTIIPYSTQLVVKVQLSAESFLLRICANNMNPAIIAVIRFVTTLRVQPLLCFDKYYLLVLIILTNVIKFIKLSNIIENSVN